MARHLEIKHIHKAVETDEAMYSRKMHSRNRKLPRVAAPGVTRTEDPATEFMDAS